MKYFKHIEDIQFSSVAQSCPTLCDPMNHSTPGLPVHHQLPEFTQTHVHRVGDAIQPSHPLLSPSPPAPNPSQHQGLFQLILLKLPHRFLKMAMSQLWWAGDTFCCGARSSQCGGFSCCEAQDLGHVASVATDPGLYSTGSAVVVHGLSCLWDLPGPGIKSMAPALAGGFLSTAPPEKSNHIDFLNVNILRFSSDLFLKVTECDDG